MGIKNCYIALGFRIKECGAIWIVLICTKQFEIDACYMGPSNEMTCNWLMYLSSHGCHCGHHVLHRMYYVMCRCGNYANMDGGFGGEACFGDIML
jgi:hypothetical protein